MEQDELEGVLDELSRDPMVVNEEIRTYTVSKLDDGTIEVRRGLPAKNGGDDPSTLDPEKSNQGKEDKEVSDTDEETKKAEEETLTKLGSDPQTSDHASESEAHMGRKKGSETCATSGDLVETFVHLDKDTLGAGAPGISDYILITCDRTTKKIKLLGAPEGIKEVECTLDNISPKLKGQPQDSAKMEPTSNAVPKRPSKGSYHQMEEVMDVEIPSPENQVPGLLAAAHLVQLEESMLPPRDHSFFAFGATLLGGKGPSQYVRQGQAYVRLYASSSANLNEPPRPPPTSRVANAHVQVFASNAPAGPEPQELLSVPRNTPFQDQSVTRNINLPDSAPLHRFPEVPVEDKADDPMTVDSVLDKLRDVEGTADPTKKSIKEAPDLGKLSKQPTGISQNREITKNDLALGKPEPPLPNQNERTTLDVHVARSFAAGIIQASDMSKNPENRHMSTLNPQVDIEEPGNPPIAVLDPSMDLAPDSPPMLYYPDDIETDELSKDQEKLPDAKDHQAELKAWSRLYPATSDSPPEEPPSSPEEDDKALDRIQANISFLAPYLERLQSRKNRREVLECLGELGLLQLTYKMTKDNLEGVQQKREHWGGEIGKRREEALKPAKSDPLIKEESPEVLSKTLGNHLAEITSNVPKVQQIAPTPGPGFEDLEDVKQQIVVLEERIEGTTSDLTTRLRELENQVYTDGCLLTELNWKSNELKKQENRVRADKKRSWKTNPRANHRYETRSVTANSNERANEVRKQLSQLTDQIKALEIKVETLRVELRSVKDKLNQVLALEFEVKKLAKTVEDQCKAQGDMNSVLMSEIASLKFAIGPSVEHQLK
ncbi:hypothetical protein BJ322DRAFT_1112252 [Thelephora terrestris]|uniref:Uncharacterized protein n=1 Tax=Thelephora terrestris TaxID=56493 RepID=A0A9P6HA19_9AGAM|nr:hypothetical protein BJ322DRAFT_1112252 [Thelephora terrestris]